jgi:hypothetical protein
MPFTERGIMFTIRHAHRRAVACLLAAFAAAPGHAQTTAPDPDAAVPETRYQPAHIGRAPAPMTTTPDRAWRENNRIVAGQAGHAGHGGHGGPAAQEDHAGHAMPAAPAAPATDPHAHHHGHHPQPQPIMKEHH